MLIYETEGFLEAEAKEIRQLHRSKGEVSFEGDNETFDLQATLCDYQDKSERRCRVAFNSKMLKRSLIYTVSDSEKKSAWAHGQEVLGSLGYDLENINLKLSPAMLEVVLRDVPGLASPEQARLHRTEHSQTISDLQKSLDDDPDSPAGKRAALKLSAEKRLEEKTNNLRQMLEGLLSPETQENEELDALLVQVKDLNSRLEAAEARAEEECAQREMSEAITAAAEKRIQELEEILVDVETQSSDELKLKRKISNLQGQVKTLKADLQTARDDMSEERDKQGLFVDDVKAAQESIAALEAALKEKDLALDALQLQLEEGLTERDELEKNVKEAELRVKVLGKELESAEQKAHESDKSVADVQELESRLVEVQQALAEALKVNQQLEAAGDASELSEDLHTLREQHALLVKDHEAIRDELAQESSVRRRLERGAVSDDERIVELEKALAELEGADRAASEGSAEDSAEEVSALRRQLEDAQSERQGLELELGDAHKMIDSLEQMIREREEGAGGWKTESPAVPADEEQIIALQEKLLQLETHLEQEQLEQKKIARELVTSEKERISFEEELGRIQEEYEKLSKDINASTRDKVESEEESTAEKRLPHELKPPPQKGAFFRPDWDLAGLPCESSEQVLSVWETVFNVQISLEGYAAQYCMAFLVVLRDGQKKKVYMLYRLKMDKHTLVCVPAKMPKDEKSLKKAINEGLKFLKNSGFEMEELATEHIDSSLGSYFLSRS